VSKSLGVNIVLVGGVDNSLVAMFETSPIMFQPHM